MRKGGKIIVLLLTLFTAWSSVSYGQGGILDRIPRPRGGGGGGGGDSLQHRTGLEDSITINFRYLDTSSLRKFDSSITDFTKRFPVPWHHYHLGNIGNATRSMLFPRLMESGWDHGFHAYDVYNFRDDETRFYNTTRPFSEINYLLGSRMEQIIQLVHTQNRLPNWNLSFQYRLINSPGFFLNQNTNHNNYRVGSWFQSKNKRYQNFLIVVGNKLQSGENGGIRDDISYLDSVGFEQRSVIPTRLGPNISSGNNFFSSDIATGTRYTNASFLFRQQYDIGQKDSIVTDSTVIPLFYPRLRAEHTINYKTYNYRFTDNSPDSAFYAQHYGIPSGPKRFYLQDYWTDLTNDFSLYQFPDAKNPQQFFKAGASFQLLTGKFDSLARKENYHNLFVHGEYRNRTRNQKWDMLANGRFYLNGLNAGDYHANLRLRRQIGRQRGYLELGFGNVNRTPSFVYDSLSSFYLGTPIDLKKENSTEIFGSIDLPRLKLKLTGRYFLVSNFSYFRNYRQPEQYATLFNVLQVMAEKEFHIGGKWNWRTWLVLQQPTGAAPLNLPLLLTRNQIGYDGSLGFKNLLTSFGLEFRYYTPYDADAYSPLIGQFFNQNSEKIAMELPELAAYLHFRIRTFTAYLRVENLNTFDPKTGKFTNNNIVSPHYPYPGMQIRLGIYWSFIN